MSDRSEFDVGSNAALDARVESGSIDVRNGPAGRVVVFAPGGDAEWTVESSGDTVTIRPVKRWRNRSARITVELPEHARVDVRSASASVRLTGTFGETHLQSASGDLLVGSLSTVNASTASGSVRVTDVVADASMTTASGDVEVGHVGGRLSVSTASGNVRAARVDGDVRVGTASGDVIVDHSNGEDISVKSVSGDVRIGLPSGIRVEPRLSTLSGTTHLPVPAPPSPPVPPVPPAPPWPPGSSGAVVASTGSGRRVVRVNVKTVSGDITIRRAD